MKNHIISGLPTTKIIFPYFTTKKSVSYPLLIRFIYYTAVKELINVDILFLCIKVIQKYLLSVNF